MSIDLAEPIALDTAIAPAPTQRRITPRTAPMTPRPVQIDPMLRSGNAFYLAIHGVAHAAGTAALLGHAEMSSWMTPSGTAATAAAVAWAVIGVGFVVSALLLAIGRGWRAPLWVTTVASIGACLIFLPAAWVGLVANAFVVLGLVASRPRR